jgi:YbbR domain-containing protein
LRQLSNKNFISFKSQLSSINKEFDSQQRVISVLPDTLYFDFSTQKTKRVPVKLMSDLHFKPQHGIYDSVQLQPEFVTLTGPEKELEKIDSWDTDTLVLHNVNRTLTTKISLKSPSKLNVAVYPSLITVKLPIGEFTEREIEVPLIIKNNLNFEEVKLLPESVKVKILIALKNYPLVDRKSFEASVDLNNWSEYGYNQLPVKISRFPKFSQLLRVEPQSADFIIQK